MGKGDPVIMATPNYVYRNLIISLERALTNDSREFARKKHVKGQYQYIPFEVDRFIEQLSAVRKILGYGGSHSFIDVGCGIGSKVVLASSLSFKAHGIEITRRYVTIAREVVAKGNMGCVWTQNTDEPEIIQGNAFKHDYKPYDVIYFYCPMVDREKQRVLEEHIVNTAKSGAYIIANNKQNHELWVDKSRVVSIGGDHGYSIYKKV